MTDTPVSPSVAFRMMASRLSMSKKPRLSWQPLVHVEEAALVLVDAHGDDDFVEHRERAFEDIQMAGRERVERTGKQSFLFHNCQLIGVFPSA